MNIAKDKYDKFKKDQQIQKNVNSLIKDIYNKKKTDTLNNIQLVNKYGY